MCAFMSFSADHVKRTTEFQWVNMLQPDDAFRILMAAAKFNASQNYFPIIPGITDYIYEFYNQIKTRKELHIPFLFLLSCMPFDSNFFNTQKFVDMYNDLFFLSLYSDNDNLKCAGVTLLFQSAKIGYIQNYPKFVSALIEMIKNQCK